MYLCASNTFRINYAGIPKPKQVQSVLPCIPLLANVRSKYNHFTNTYVLVIAKEYVRGSAQYKEC